MANVFLGCFLVGFLLTLGSVLLGAGHGGADAGHDGAHLPHLPGDGAGHAAGHGAGHAGDASGHQQTAISPLNSMTLMGFLMGFGGFGYLMVRLGWLGTLLALPVAAVAGVGSGALVWLLLRFVIRGERTLPFGGGNLVGTFGRLSVGIRDGHGTGELMYLQHGVWQACAAKSETGAAIAAGTEVTVLRMAEGCAYVIPLLEANGRMEEQS